MRKQGSCLDKEIMQGTMPGEEDHARPGWTTSIRGQDSLWKSQSEWQRTEMNGESTSMNEASKKGEKGKVKDTKRYSRRWESEGIRGISPDPHESQPSDRGRLKNRKTGRVDVTMKYFLTFLLQYLKTTMVVQNKWLALPIWHLL